MPVYIVATDAESKVVKIGWTTNLKARMNGLQTSVSTRLTLLRVIECDISGESWMHARYKHLRLSGEWFQLDPEMLTIEPVQKNIVGATGARAAKRVWSQNLIARTYPADAIGKADNRGLEQRFDYAAGKWVPKDDFSPEQAALHDLKPIIAVRVASAIKRGLSREQIIGVLLSEVADLTVGAKSEPHNQSGKAA